MGSVHGKCFVCGTTVGIEFSGDEEQGNGIELGNKLICDNCLTKIKEYKNV